MPTSPIFIRVQHELKETQQLRFIQGFKKKENCVCPIFQRKRTSFHPGQAAQLVGASERRWLNRAGSGGNRPRWKFLSHMHVIPSHRCLPSFL